MERDMLRAAIADMAATAAGLGIQPSEVVDA
jgi:hypothetical protein